ncbi:MAG: 16S rRNA (cytidine(1402)-2'-O)-methyltransferase [Chloroflexi bacterium]|nr:16S rRNA (cytidine(1402)-2'-O)-methyltransferase [Chloroflexota bacterium]
MGTLYVVATPIGNLEDITLRALRVLRSVSLIAAEDTRQTRKLLAKYDIQTAVTSYFEHNKLAKLDYILETLREKDVAIVSDAGTPGISDPGFELIRAAAERGIEIEPIPGPSAVIAALSASGLPTDQFVYVGFLPRKRGDRIRELKLLAIEPRTVVAYEAPHRVLESLKDIEEVLGDRRVAIVRELTKVHEEIFRGLASQAIGHFAANPPRGEFTLVIAGAGKEARRLEPSQIEDRLSRMLAEGRSSKEAIALISGETGVPRREIYRLWLELKASSE